MPSHHSIIEESMRWSAMLTLWTHFFPSLIHSCCCFTCNTDQIIQVGNCWNGCNIIWKVYSSFYYFPLIQPAAKSKLLTIIIKLDAEIEYRKKHTFPRTSSCFSIVFEMCHDKMQFHTIWIQWSFPPLKFENKNCLNESEARVPLDKHLFIYISSWQCTIYNLPDIKMWIKWLITFGIAN